MATNPPSDSPDWTGIPGSLRYLGVINMSGSGFVSGELVVAPASYDYGLLVIALGSPASATGLAEVNVFNSTSGFETDRQDYYANGGYENTPFHAFIAAAIPGVWKVRAAVDSASGSTWQLYVFAGPGVPVARIVDNGTPIPVVQQGAPHRVPYDSQSFNQPAVGVRAVITLPAIAGFGWVIDHAVFRLLGRGTADIQNARILDGGAAVWAVRMAVTATLGSNDEHVIGPGAGIPISIGAVGTIDFSLAPAAANFEIVTCGAYLVRAVV